MNSSRDSPSLAADDVPSCNVALCTENEPLSAVHSLISLICECDQVEGEYWEAARSTTLNGYLTQKTWVKKYGNIWKPDITKVKSAKSGNRSQQKLKVAGAGGEGAGGGKETTGKSGNR